MIDMIDSNKTIPELLADMGIQMEIGYDGHIVDNGFIIVNELQYVDFYFADLAKAIFSLDGRGCQKIRLCDFRLADMTSTILNKLHIDWCDFSEATMSDAVWIDSVIDCSRFRSAKMNEINLSGVKGSRIDFSGASMAGAKFVSSVFVDANFKGADLIGADFTDSILINARFDDADMTGVIGLPNVIYAKTDYTTREDIE